MSDTSSLTALARFVGQSRLSTPEPLAYRRTISAIAGRLQPRPAAGYRVADLLGAVLALSARTRRMALPPARIEVDVFAPGGGRAVRLHLPG
ncbi:hypothetical protein [Devosia sp.]|uniref:hypothetical protein n=1 Tax=Devosia sp. TaxID=1871048 RepID=UPI002F1B22D0